MIKMIVSDIDGVIVGEKIGFNSPYPNPAVIFKLKEIRSKGIPIALCTAKPYYSIKKIIEDAKLKNPHITDAGAVIIDPLDDTIVAKREIKKELVLNVIKICLKNNIYVEIHALNDYFIQKNQEGDINKIHKHILQKSPKIVPSLVDISMKEETVVIMPVAKDLEDKKKIDLIFTELKNKLAITWGIHPVALPLQFCIITKKGNSKPEAVVELIKKLNFEMNEILGIGDSTADWKFMNLCGYAATLENGSKEIKDLVKTKEKGRGFISQKSVDENGILDIFDYFSSHFETNIK